MRQLVPCPGCARHVRLSEPTCPFCGDGSPRAAPTRRAPLAVRSRAAILGATLATTAAAASGCYDDHGSDDASVTTDARRVAVDDTGVSDPDTGAAVAAYGGPIFVDDAAFEPDAGAPAAEYGGPPLFDDAGVDAHVGDPGADYGGPPSE